MKLRIFFAIILALGLCTASTTLLAADYGNNPSKTSRSSLSYDQIKEAAEKGDADAQYALGYMYYYGKSGAPRDLIKAKQWIGKAASQQQPQAVRALALLSKKQTTANSHEETTTQSQSPMAARETRQKWQNAKTDDQARDDHEGMTLVDMRKQPQSAENQPVSSVHASGDAAMSSGYTLQLLGAYQKEQVVKMIQKHHLSKAEVYQTSYNNKDWYILLYGHYSTRDEANSAAKDLEKELAVKPWAKPYSSVKTYKKVSLD